MDQLIVAIDGPAGSGKTTISRSVAIMLDMLYLDTGAMYRAVAYAAIKDNVDVADFDKITQVFENNCFDFSYCQKEKKMQVFLNGKELIDEIRTNDVEIAVSDVARNGIVRELLVALQRKISTKEKRVILDGRDIGTVVFPDADVKIFLTAKPEERARRRLKDKKLPESELMIVMKDLLRRDKIDSERAIGPLKQADDAVLIDTTELSLDEVINKVKELIIAKK